MAKTAEETKLAKAAANKRYAAKKKEAALAAKTPVAKKAPVTKAKAPVAKATVAKKAKAPSKNIDVISDFLKVGDSAKIKSKAKSTLGEMINAEVVKIYACSRTGKDYVRLRADGHTYHKRLDALSHAE